MKISKIISFVGLVSVAMTNQVAVGKKYTQLNN
jgi:hypothetical protein